MRRVLLILPALALVACRADVPTEPVQLNVESAADPTVYPASWLMTGSMIAARGQHNAVLLEDGTVLVVNFTTYVAELYDPTAGEFTSIGLMAFMHGQGATATRLDDGRVLIVGGTIAPTAAEVFDPSDRSFTSTGSPAHGRMYHSATLLSDGRVLFAAGYRDWSPRQSQVAAELYDPTTGMFVATGNLNTDRADHSATRLADGRVLVLGGIQEGEIYGGCLRSAELYDPVTGAFTLASNMLQPRCSLWATDAPLLRSGKVLVTGGRYSTGTVAELFDPATGTFAATGDMSVIRWMHSASLLLDGTVLLSGGFNLGSGTAAHVLEADRYDPTTGTFSLTATLNEGRYGHTATALHDGRVLVTGGVSIEKQTFLRSAELYTTVTGDRIAALIDDVYTLADEGVLRDNQVRGLVGKLEAAIQALERGMPNVAINKLRDFISQVEGRLSPEVGQSLIATAVSIVEQLG